MLVTSPIRNGLIPHVGRDADHTSPTLRRLTLRSLFLVHILSCESATSESLAASWQYNFIDSMIGAAA